MKRTWMGWLPGQPGELQQFVVVEALEHHAVDLDGAESQGEGGLDPGQDVGQVVAAREFPVALPLQAVQTQIEVAQPRGIKVRGQLREQHPVGGEADLFQTRDAVQATDELHDALTHQGFAAGDPDLANAHAGGHPGQAEQLFIAQDFPARQFLPAVPGGAIEAAEIAAVGDGEAQVIDVVRQSLSHLTAGLRTED